MEAVAPELIFHCTAPLALAWDFSLQASGSVMPWVAISRGSWAGFSVPVVAGGALLGAEMTLGTRLSQEPG